MTDTNRKCDEVPGTNGFECGQCPFDNVCDITFVEEHDLLNPGDAITEGPYQGGRVIVVVNVIWKQNLEQPEYQLLRVVRGAVTFYTIWWNLIKKWGEVYKSVNDLYALIPEYTVEHYTYEFDRLYPLFPPRLMQDLDTGEYNKRDPNLDYVQRQRKRRGLHK